MRKLKEMNVKVVPGKRGKFLLRWRDPQTNKYREKQTEFPVSKRHRKGAERLAQELENELVRGHVSSRFLPFTNPILIVEPGELADHGQINGDWEPYKLHVIQAHLALKSPDYQKVMSAIINRFEEYFRPNHVSQITNQAVRGWIAYLKMNSNISDNTLKSYWGHLISFLKIAIDDGLMVAAKKPNNLPKRDRNQSLKRGRRLSLEEFERMLSAVDSIRPKWADDWKFILNGLWNSGLRIGEAYRIAWDSQTSDFYIDFDRHNPCYKILVHSKKQGA